MKIQLQGKKIFVDQTNYLYKVVECFGMSNAQGAQTPLPGTYVSSESKDQADPDFKQKYHIMLRTRPDICYAVTKLAQFAANPSNEHMTSAKYICRYLNSTSDYALVFDGFTDAGLIAFTDSNCISVLTYLFPTLYHLVPPGTRSTISQVDNLQSMSKTVQEFYLFYLFLTRKPNKFGKFENLTIF